MGHIVGIGTSVPDRVYEQQEISEYLVQITGEQHRSKAVDRIFQQSGVSKRHMVVDRDFFVDLPTTQTRNDYYMAAAVPLAQQALEQALKEATLTAADIDDLIVVSCTGFSIPGIDLHLAHRMSMRPDLRRSCVLGMGCYGSFPGLLRAVESVSTNPEKIAAVVPVELCSLHMQMELTTENIVATSLFSDGAGAVIISGKSYSDDLPRIIDSATFCDYQTMDKMAFEVTDYGFQMRLSSYVPDVLAANVEDFVTGLLGPHGLWRGKIRFWGIHPGSKKIVNYIQERLQLLDEQVAFSHDVLNDYGNMSSATILFVLDQIQRCGSPEPGDYGVMMAFGPGLTMEAVLVQW